MSEKPESESSNPKEENSVFDFLYYDARRVGSFQAQLGGHGSRGKIKQREETSESSSHTGGTKAGINVPMVAGTEITQGDAVSDARNVSLEREFDPYWINGLDLYIDLDALGLVRRDLSSARIGQIVMVKGALLVVDFAMFRQLWGKPSIQALIQIGIDSASSPSMPLGNRADRRRNSHGNGPRQAQPTTGDFVGEVLSVMPHPVQARLRTEQGQTVWSSLKPENVVVETTDFLLKHGSSIAGRWNILGVLDALPEDTEPDALQTALMVDFETSPFGAMVSGFAPLLQSGFGRPGDAYGVTPLLIFREVLGG